MALHLPPQQPMLLSDRQVSALAAPERNSLETAPKPVLRRLAIDDSADASTAPRRFYGRGGGLPTLRAIQNFV